MSVLENPSKEIHDDIMQLLSQTKRMKLTSSSSPIHLGPCSEDSPMKEKLMFLFPSISKENLESIISSSLEASILNVVRNQKSSKPSSFQEINQFGRKKKRNFNEMEGQSSFQIKETAQKKEENFFSSEIDSNSKERENKLRNVLYNILHDKKDLIQLKKREILIKQHIINVKKDNADLKKTLSVVTKKLLESKSINDENTKLLNQVTKEKNDLISEIQKEEYKNTVYNEIINQINNN